MGPLVKICGLTRPADARFCDDAGADLLGVIFAPSARQVTVGLALDIRGAVTRARLVGVFTDTSPGDIAEVVAAVGLDLVQLHDCDDPGRWEAVAHAAGTPVLPAVTADRADAATAAILARPNLRLAGLLLDLPKNSARVTSADRCDLLTAARRCRQAGVRVILAGALAVDTVAQAVREARPVGLDVCRGVESAPGIKDPELVARFLAAADDPEVDRVN